MKQPRISGIESLDMSQTKWFVESRAGYIMDLEASNGQGQEHLALELFYVDTPAELIDLINDPRIDVSAHDDPRVKTTGPILFPRDLVGTVMQDITESINTALSLGNQE